MIHLDLNLDLMEADSEHLGAWCGCPEQGALPGWSPGSCHHRPGPLYQPGRRQSAGKIVAPHGDAVTEPGQPPRPCLAWGAIINPCVFSPSCAKTPCGTTPTVATTAHCGRFVATLIRKDGGAARVGPATVRGMPGVVVPQAEASRRSTGHGRWAADLGKRGMRRWFGQYRPPSPAVLAGQKGHHPVDMEGKAFTPRSRVPFLPSGCGLGVLSFEFFPLIALQMERPGRGRRPPSRPGGLHGRSCSVRALRAPALLALRSAAAIGCGWALLPIRKRLSWRKGINTRWLLI